MCSTSYPVFKEPATTPERHQAPDAQRTPSGRLAPRESDLVGRFLGNLTSLLKPTGPCQAPCFWPRCAAGRDVDSSSRVWRWRPQELVGGAFRVSDLGARNRACLGTNAESETQYYAPRAGVSTLSVNRLSKIPAREAISALSGDPYPRAFRAPAASHTAGQRARDIHTIPVIGKGVKRPGHGVRSRGFVHEGSLTAVHGSSLTRFEPQRFVRYLEPPYFLPFAFVVNDHVAPVVEPKLFFATTRQ